MKTIVIIQARMGSTRLPNKILLPLAGHKMIEHVLERASLIEGVSEVVLATTNLKEDDILENIALDMGVSLYRGSEKNVLDRYYQAAKISKADHIIRITSDCPLIDPYLSSSLLKEYLNQSYDYAHLTGFPRGLDTEVFSYRSLQKCSDYARMEYQKEHVTPYIYENPREFKIYDFESDIDHSYLRWTVDTEEDYKAIELIYKFLSTESYSWKSVLKIINENPEISLFNQHILQKKLGE